LERLDYSLSSWKGPFKTIIGSSGIGHFSKTSNLIRGFPNYQFGTSKASKFFIGFLPNSFSGIKISPIIIGLELELLPRLRVSFPENFLFFPISFF